MAASMDSENQQTELSNKNDRLLPSADDCIYTSCFCEENVWWLCDHVRRCCSECLNTCYAVFISNLHETIPLWQQKASEADDGAVVWDYHVIFVHRDRDLTNVYDLDSRLTFPCGWEQYIQETVKNDSALKPQYRRMFRVIAAGSFLETFASDRSHMLTPDGIWLKPPPTYPCLATAESTNNLPEFINMDADKGFGSVMNFNQFCEFLRPDPPDKKKKSKLSQDT